MTSANYFSVKPSYTVRASRPDEGPGHAAIAPTDVLLTNVWEKEVKTVVEILRRMGMDISVQRNRPFTGFADEFRAQTVVEVDMLPVEEVDEEDTCMDCGGDIYGPGAPAICAYGHKCRKCNWPWNHHPDSCDETL